ncbi:hypothetical protein [Ekhidna sp.]|uniref:hypothetical protein n=1 Tax=Ekhidna sp. TaxID=2608089 RepID=UPI003C7A5A0F
MPVEIVKVQKNQGMVTIKVTIHPNIPIWNYMYREDMDHDNSTAQNLPKEHSLGKPHELNKSVHNWAFLVSNSSKVDINNVDVGIEWFQDINGTDQSIHQWNSGSFKIKAEKGESIQDQIIIQKI